MVLTKGISPNESPQRENAKGGRAGKKGRSSPGKIQTPPRKATLSRSSGSEAGSIERLVDGGRHVIATKHLLPESNINVVVRVRPLSSREIKAADDMAVQFPGDGQIYCESNNRGSGDRRPRLFSYNVVFEPTATQEDILQFSGIKKLIEMSVEGFSCTAFCYGQTGSGKTHTLTGPPGLFDRMNTYSEDHGLVFRSFVYLFKLLQERQECNFVLRASFLEIYNEKVIDLLNPGTSRKPLAVRWSKKTRGFFVENLFTVECEELDDLLAVLEEGLRNRSIGRHNMNEHSSRSHSILTVYITSEQQMENGVFISRQGKINFVDLAGSEMTKKTQSEGKTLEEANNINKSLMVLGYCISSLSDGKRKGVHIPYRDSKLTKLLADSLAGNGVTLMIACVSPARSNASETLNTLRYAARAKKIRTKPIVVMDPREALILSLKREVGALQTENDYLRTALHLGNDAQSFVRSESKAERVVPSTPPLVDMEKLAQMEGHELSQLIHAYITENEALRRENAELYATREQVIRDQELVCRENERLLKKLEDVNSVCCRSPIIPARPTFSAEVLNGGTNDDIPGATNVWMNPNTEPSPPPYSTPKVSMPHPIHKSADSMPDKVKKELDRRRIIGSHSNVVEAYKATHRRHNSWDDTGTVSQNPAAMCCRKSSLRRTSTVPEQKRDFPKVNNALQHPADLSPNASPDSILSGSLGEGANSAPDTAESAVPTAPFPGFSTSPSPLATPEPEDTESKMSWKSRRRRENDQDEKRDRPFGSPVSVDEEDVRF